MKLTKKLKKVMLLSILGITTVILAGIASTKVIQTEIARRSGNNEETQGYTLETSANALENPENGSGSKEAEESNNDIEAPVSDVIDKDLFGYKTEPDLATRK